MGTPYQNLFKLVVRVGTADRGHARDPARYRVRRDGSADPAAASCPGQRVPEAQTHCETLQRSAQTARRDAVAARREVKVLRGRAEQLGRKVDQLRHQVDSARLEPARAAAPVTALRDPDVRDEVRRLKRELDQARAHALDQDNELSALRAFFAFARRGDDDTAFDDAVVDAPPAVDLNEARVIVVGGRPRFHQKLRRLLPRGVFLHPDLSMYPADVFPGADCVVFCMEYCSRTMAIAAIDLARRYGVRSGYANHCNPDLVVQRVRELLAA